MSVVKRIIQDNIEKVKVDELLAEEYEQAGYGGITLTKTPLGTQINLFAMRPGRVIGKRGRAIKAASERLETELGLPNPQITVVEVEVPELSPRIMAARIANALERGVHYRRALFWSLRRTMESGALGCEIVLRGKLRSDRSRYEKVSEGFIPKSGEPVLRYVKIATKHVKMKKGTFGITVTIVPPDAKFPDKISLEGLPTIEYPEEEYILPEGVEPESKEIAEGVEGVTAQPSVEGTQAEHKSATETESTKVEIEPHEVSASETEKNVESVEKKEPTEEVAKAGPDVIIEPVSSDESVKSVSKEESTEEQLAEHETAVEQLSKEPEKVESSEEDAQKISEPETVDAVDKTEDVDEVKEE